RIAPQAAPGAIAVNTDLDQAEGIFPFCAAIFVTAVAASGDNARPFPCQWSPSPHVRHHPPGP
ncbi:hypothetical protein, partial [Pseudomonas sp. BIOMIG1BD]|uniref:hypothetical protein n=1 Tax=Pseudomonas sp. BIOMIG1BD TaxID=1758731 RepID=UPI0019D3281A